MRTTLAFFAFLALSSAAMALNNRSAVSVNGLDSNACSVASPCRSFGVALAATADGGEVVALDSAGYGPFSIGQNVTVTGAPGVHAAITATTGDAIDVTGGDRVVIANLFILGNRSGSNGIVNTGAAFLHIYNCYVQGFVSRGIQSTGATATIVIDHCTFDSNTTGIEFDDTNGSVENCSINSNSTGIYFVSATRVSVADITQTTLRFNETGINLSSNGGAYIVVDRCSLFGDNTGFQVIGGALTMTWVLISNNLIDFLTASGTYEIFTFGNNVIHNKSANLTPTSLQ